MAEFASKGVAGAGLGLGIAGTALALLNNNGLFGRVNGNGGSTDININAPDVEVSRLRGYYSHHGVSHYELNLVREIAAKDAIIVDKDAKLYTNQEVCKLRDDFNAYKLDVERRFAYDERLIAENKCEIEKVRDELHCNYIKADKVLRPWDICPQPWNDPASASTAAVKPAKATA